MVRTLSALMAPLLIAVRVLLTLCLPLVFGFVTPSSSLNPRGIGSLLSTRLGYNPFPLLPWLASFYSSIESNSAGGEVVVEEGVDPRGKIPQYVSFYNDLAPLLSSPSLTLTPTGYVIPEHTLPKSPPLSSTVVTTSMKSWIQSTVCDLNLCPYTRSSSIAGENIKNVKPGKIHYRTSNDITINGLSDFYNFVDYIMTNDEVQANSGILSFPKNTRFEDFQGFCEICKFGLVREQLLI